MSHLEFAGVFGRQVFVSTNLAVGLNIGGKTNLVSRSVNRVQGMRLRAFRQTRRIIDFVGSWMIAFGLIGEVLKLMVLLVFWIMPGRGTRLG